MYLCHIYLTMTVNLFYSVQNWVTETISMLDIGAFPDGLIKQRPNYYIYFAE